jgi:LacI family transcriptional regulator
VSVTIRDVANATGLSVATISKYLNGAVLKERNRIAVQEAIEQLGYRKNEFARSLKTNRSMSVGVLIPDIGHPFHSSITRSLERTLMKLGYTTIICNYLTDDAIARPAKERIEFLLDKRVDGVAMFPLNGLEDALSVKELASDVPIVLIDASLEGVDADAVMVDNEAASCEATSYFLVRGHKRIGALFGPEDHYSAILRAAGFRQAYKNFGFQSFVELERFGDYTMDSGKRMMLSLMDSANPPSAVFASNYELMVGAMMAIHERRINIPKDLSFIGFDDSLIASVFSPGITAIAQPVCEIGEMAARLLVARMQGQEDSPPITLRLKARLVERESVCSH